MSQASTSFDLGALDNRSGFMGSTVPNTMKNNPLVWIAATVAALALVCYILVKSK